MLLKILPKFQIMQLIVTDQIIATYQVSTAKNGLGEEHNSEKTPRGWHEIAEKIGGDQPTNTVFVGRIPTGEIYSPELAKHFPGRDWILTRILWLAGLELGKNLGGKVDTKQRYIYVHGSPDECQLGVPGSMGCIRMRNADLLTVFDLVTVGTKVYIEA